MKPASLIRRAFVALALIVPLAGCAGNRPVEVTKAVAIDDKGRKVTLYHVCKRSPWRLSLDGSPVCRTERITENYCYRTLGKVDCYDQPWPGRSRASLID